MKFWWPLQKFRFEIHLYHTDTPELIHQSASLKEVPALVEAQALPPPEIFWTKKSWKKLKFLSGHEWLNLYDHYIWTYLICTFQK